MSTEQNKTVSTEIPETKENNDMHKHLSCDHIKNISKWEKFKSVVVYFGADRKPAIISVGFVIFFAVVFLFVSDKYKFMGLLANYIDEKQLLSTIIQLATFLAIVSIWYRTIRKEWMQQLNKYLSVTFVYKGNKRIECRYAKLVDVADARGMAQSFAQVLNCGGRLSIAPSLKEIIEKIKVDGNPDVEGDCCFLVNGGKPFLHYDVEITLTKNIETLCKEYISEYALVREIHQQVITRKETENEKENNENTDQKNNGSSKEIEIPNDEYLQWDNPFNIDSKIIIKNK